MFLGVGLLFLNMEKFFFLLDYILFLCELLELDVLLGLIDGVIILLFLKFFWENLFLGVFEGVGVWILVVIIGLKNIILYRVFLMLRLNLVRDDVFFRKLEFIGEIRLFGGGVMWRGKEFLRLFGIINVVGIWVFYDVILNDFVIV